MAPPELRELSSQKKQKTVPGTGNGGYGSTGNGHLGTVKPYRTGTGIAILYITYLPSESTGRITGQWTDEDDLMTPCMHDAAFEAWDL